MGRKSCWKLFGALSLVVFAQIALTGAAAAATQRYLRINDFGTVQEYSNIADFLANMNGEILSTHPVYGDDAEFFIELDATATWRR